MLSTWTTENDEILIHGLTQANIDIRWEDGDITALSDVPERKDDMVRGTYHLPVLEGVTMTAKTIDMLGEEVLVNRKY